MLAVFLTEIAAWRKLAAIQTCLVFLGAVGLPWLVSGGQLLAGLGGMSLGLFGLAWSCAFERWTPVRAWQWTSQRGVAAFSVVAGKVLAFLVLSLLHLALALPLFVLIVTQWGVPPEVGLAMLGISLSGASCFLVLVLMPVGAASLLRGLPGLLLAVGWLSLGVVVQDWRLTNPFIQLLDLADGRSVADLAGGWALVALLLALTILLDSLILGWNYRRVRK